MSKTKAEIKNAYAKRNYDDIRLQVPKGEKEIIRAFAEAQNKSLQGFIRDAIKSAMESQS